MKQHIYNVLTITFLATGLYFILFGNLVYAIVSLVISYVFSVYAFRTFLENMKREIANEIANKFVTEIRNVFTPQTIASFITSVLLAISVSQSQSRGGEGRSSVGNRADRADADSNTTGSETANRQIRNVITTTQIRSDGT